MSSTKLTNISTVPAQRLTERLAWKALKDHCAALSNPCLWQLFNRKPSLASIAGAE